MTDLKIESIARLEMQHGDILVVKCPEGVSTAEIRLAGDRANELVRMMKLNIRVLVLRHGYDLQVVGEGAYLSGNSNEP